MNSHPNAALMRRVLDDQEKTLGPDHPVVATTLGNLAAILERQSKYDQSETLLWRALAIQEKTLGPEHPNVARDLFNLAVLFQATNRLAEAEPLMRRALAIDEQFYGTEHPNIAARLLHLDCLDVRGRDDRSVSAGSRDQRGRSR